MRCLLARRWPWIVSILIHSVALAALASNLVDTRPKAASVPAPIEMALSPQVVTPAVPRPDTAEAEAQPPDEIKVQRQEVKPAEVIPRVEPMPQLAETQPVVRTEAQTVPPPPPKPVIKPPGPIIARAPSPAPPSPAPPVPAPVRTAVPPAAAPSPPQIAALPPAAGRPGADADYFATVLAWLEKHKEYPRQSQLRRQQGTAVLHFELDRQGRILSYRIRTSSGFPELDREVEAMIRRAEPLPPMPADMAQARLELLVPVQFRLR